MPVGKVAATAAAIVCSGAVPVQLVGWPNQASSESIRRWVRLSGPSSVRARSAACGKSSPPAPPSNASEICGASQSGEISASSEACGSTAPTRPTGLPAASDTARVSTTPSEIPSHGVSSRCGTSAPGGAAIARRNQDASPTIASVRANGAEAASNCPSALSMKVAAEGNNVCSRNSRAVCSTRSVPAKSAARTAWTCSVKRDSVASTPAATPCAASVASWPAWRPVWASSAPARMIQMPKNSPAATARADGSTNCDRTARTVPRCFTMTFLVFIAASLVTVW